MTLDLKGLELEAFCKALVTAFPTWSDLERMVEVQLGVQLESIVTKAKLEAVVFDLVKWARAKSRLDELLAGARRANPTNTALQRLASALAPGNDAARDRVPGPAIAASPQPPVEIGGVVSWIGRNWQGVTYALFVFGLVLVMGSIGLDVHRKTVVVREVEKQVGYLSSLNWSVVYVVLCPAAFLFSGKVIEELVGIAGALGARPLYPDLATSWRRAVRRLPAAWFVLSLVAAVLYTLVEGWVGLIRGGECTTPEFVGWTNILCKQAGVAPKAFLVLATVAQIIMLATGWLMFTAMATLCGLGLTRKWPTDDDSARRLDRLLSFATLGWAVLLAALCLARLWSFHLQTSSGGLLGSVLDGPLFEWVVFYQTDYGSLVGLGLIALMGIAPFEIAHWQTGHPRSRIELVMIVVCALALPAMMFPRLGVWIVLSTSLTLIVVPQLRRTTTDPSTRARDRIPVLVAIIVAGVLAAVGAIAGTPGR